MSKCSFFLGCDGKIRGVKKLRSLVLALSIFFLSVSSALAAECDFSASPLPFARGQTVTVRFGLDPNERPENLRVCNGDTSDGCYQIRACKDRRNSFEPIGNWCDTNTNFPLGNQRIEGNSIIATFTAEDVNYALDLQMGDILGRRNQGICGSYSQYIEYDPNLTPGDLGQATCEPGTFSAAPGRGNYFVENVPIFFRIDGSKTSGFVAGEYYVNLQGDNGIRLDHDFGVWGPGPRSIPTFDIDDWTLRAGTYQLEIRDSARHELMCAGPTIKVCPTGDNSEECSIDAQSEITEPILTVAKFDYCMQVPEGEQRAACKKCIGGSESAAPPYANEGKKIYTAVGCINVDEQGFAADLIQLLLGVAGGVALLSILAGAFIFTTSQGESGRVKQAKELITAAVSGLFFIIFSIIILDFIGVKILQIPGLG